jgi:HEAT repeat protein
MTRYFRPLLCVILNLVILGCTSKEAGTVGGDIRELVQALKEGDDPTRARAAQALGDLGPDAREAVPALRAALRDEYEMVRENAAEALGDMGPAAKLAVPELISTMRDSVVPVREAAKEALRKIAPAAAAKAGA